MPELSSIEGLYVHIPFCDGKCHYCAFYSVPYSREAGAAWFSALRREWELSRCLLPPLNLDTVFIGGGTPSLLHPELLDAVLNMIGEGAASNTQKVEWTCEANPGSLDAARLDVMKSRGVNRISLGVQSLTETVLVRLGRRHRVADIHASIELILSAGFTNWNIDLIACVPGVTRDEWRTTVETAVRLGSPHISVYALTREEGTRLAQDHRAGRSAIMDEDDQLRMLDEAESILSKAGFCRYEISNYAKPGFECRHNRSCWRGGNYLGLGCAAASRVGNRRWTNKADVNEYVKVFLASEHSSCLPPGARQEDEILSPQTDALERLIFGLRMAEGVDLDVILRTPGGVDAGCAEYWRRTLVRLAREGLLVNKGQQWGLTARGRALADHVAVELIP